MEENCRGKLTNQRSRPLNLTGSQILVMMSRKIDWNNDNIGFAQLQESIRTTNIDTIYAPYSVFVDQKLSEDSLMQEFQRVLKYHSKTLTTINLSQTNARGLIFYDGKEFPVENPLKENVSIEAYTKNGQPIVRDDAPPVTKYDLTNQTTFRYIRTSVESSQKGDKKFIRSYVRLNWLENLVNVDMSATKVSGYGVTSLVTSCANTLENINISDCAFVDNRALYSISQICQKLKILDCSSCNRITTHGIFYLSEIPNNKATILRNLNIRNRCVNNQVASALLHALERRGFSGTIIADDFSQTGDTSSTSILSALYNSNKDTLFDLAFNDITLKRKFEKKHWFMKDDDDDNNLPGFELDLSCALINDEVLQHISTIWGPKLHTLRLDGTYITEKGLSMLSGFYNLKTLTVSKCHNILDKSIANKSLQPALATMTNLIEFDLSDTRISGKALMVTKNLKLQILNASRSPMSVFAIRLLSEKCKYTLKELSLSGCSFINKNAMKYLCAFNILEYLDISNCRGLKGDELELFATTERLTKMKLLRLTGIPGLNSSIVSRISTNLSFNAGTSISIITDSLTIDSNTFSSMPINLQRRPSKDGRERILDACPYHMFQPSPEDQIELSHQLSQISIEKHEKDKQELDYNRKTPSISPPLPNQINPKLHQQTSSLISGGVKGSLYKEIKLEDLNFTNSQNNSSLPLKYSHSHSSFQNKNSSFSNSNYKEMKAEDLDLSNLSSSSLPIPHSRSNIGINEIDCTLNIPNINNNNIIHKSTSDSQLTTKIRGTNPNFTLPTYIVMGIDEVIFTAPTLPSISTDKSMSSLCSQSSNL